MQRKENCHSSSALALFLSPFFFLSSLFFHSTSVSPAQANLKEPYMSSYRAAAAQQVRRRRGHIGTLSGLYLFRRKNSRVPGEIRSLPMKNV